MKRVHVHTETIKRAIHLALGRPGIVRIAGLTVLLCAVAFSNCAKDEDFSKEELNEFQKAQSLYRAQKFDDAKDILAKLTAQKPNNIEAGVLRAKIHFFTREYDKAEALLRNYQDNDDDNPYVLMWLGKTVAVQEKRNAEAIEIFRAIVQRDPENYLARYYLGRCLEREKKLKPALEQYYNALALEYELTKIHQHLSKLLTEMKMTSRAEHHLGRVAMLRQRPGTAKKAARKEAAAKKPAATAKKPATVRKKAGGQS